MKLCILICLFLGLQIALAGDSVAGRLAQMAREAENSGQIVRAYLLFAEAAARAPNNVTYRGNRDALAPAAKILTKAQVQEADISKDIEKAEAPPTAPEPPVEIVSEAEWKAAAELQPVPEVHASPRKADFNLNGTTRTLLEQVTSTYGVHAIPDAGLETTPATVHFEITQADFHTALEALTAATHTFVFPVSSNTVYFAADTEAKRNELEPVVVLTFPLPEAVKETDLIDAANAVRGVLNMRAVGWDSLSRRVIIRDRVTRARVARAVMEAVLLPKAQVSFEVQFLALDSEISYHYGSSLQTSFPFAFMGHIGGFQTDLSALSGPYAVFGGGATLMGIQLADSLLLANYTKSVSKNLLNATVVVSNGQTADVHFGDKYPIAQTLYTGFQQSQGPALYNPAAEITMVDLGLVLKLTPHVNGEGEIGLDVEAAYQTLGNHTFNTVPSIAHREFKGSVVIREGEWATIMGLDAESVSKTRNGLAGIGDIPGVNQILAENTRDTQKNDTMILIKPTITRLPMSAYISPQFLIGPPHGERVIL